MQHHWLTAHPLWAVHWTSPHASWLNQIELCFSAMSRRVICLLTLVSVSWAFSRGADPRLALC